MPVLTPKVLPPLIPSPSPEDVFSSILNRMDAKNPLPIPPVSYDLPANPSLVPNTADLTQPDSLPQQKTLSIQSNLPNNDDISAALTSLGVQKPIEDSPNEKFLAELNKVNATPKKVATYIAGLMMSSNSDAVRLQCMKIILAVNGINFSEEKASAASTLPQINIVLNNGNEDRRIASMLNPR